MAEIVGMLAAAALEMAAGKIAQAAGDRIMLQWRFGEDLEDMKRTTESILAVLEDAEGQSMKNKSVQLWLERLTQASYHISDMFEEFEVNSTRKSVLRKVKVLNPCLTLSSEIRMAGKMKVVRENLDKISNERHKYGFTISSCFNDQQVINERVTSSEVIEAKIVGRDQEKQKIVALLRRESTFSEFIILSIYGLGGIGKTTLAQLLFNDTHFKDYEKAWVYVSQTFDLNKIKETVRSQLQLKQGKPANTQEQDAGPSAPKSILIVLDDLWEKDDFKLDDLKESLKIIGSGRKVHVIVTTRDAGIAEKFQTIQALNIQVLSVDLCWAIIKQIAWVEDNADNERFEYIGKEIAKKCEGVALAARAIGYILRSKKDDIHGWVSVKDSGIWNVSSPEPSPYDNVLASLKLSYSSMRPHLRLCFAYCAVFPKGHAMTKDELIYQWAALGFIKPSDGASIRQHGENCIKQLLEMSFFQHSESPSSNEQHSKDAKFFTMHDLVHDLARSVMGDEILDASRKFNAGKRNCRYAFLEDCSKPLKSFVTYADKIRALIFLRSGKMGNCSAGFSCAKYLRVLDLGKCSLKKLPSSIGQLKLLRYLNAPRIQDRIIPSCITKLSKLIYLSLRASCEILALPESIGEMEGLMYLDLSGCEGIKMLPESFGKLENLVHLDLSDCSQVNVITEALGSLTKLQHLNLSQKLNSEKMSTLRRMPEVIRKLIELRYLNVSGCSEMVSMLYLDNFFDSISTLSNLEHLDLSNIHGLFIIPDRICSLRKLHTLDLTGCLNLIRLPGNMARMDSLKHLILNDCCYLDTSSLPINKSLIPLPNFAVHAAEGEQSSNLIMLKDLNPPDLEISHLENVKSIEETGIMELRGKQSMLRLSLDWTRGTKGFIEDMELLKELVPPSSLELFRLRGYNSVSFPAWVKCIAVYLPHLVSVALVDLSQCCSLPPFGQLPNLENLHLGSMPSIKKIDRSFCGDSLQAFTRLEYLNISDMENLEEWNTTYSYGEGITDEFMFPNLKYLEIVRCRKLRLGPCPPRVKAVWCIQECDGVLLQWEGAPHSVCSSSPALVHTLIVDSCTAPMHQWKLFHHLPALNQLIVDNCNDLSSSPEIAEVIFSLQSLSFIGCSGIQKLPQWLGDLTSLRSLSLIDCWSIQELPEWLGDLVYLKELYIQNCMGIMYFPESIKQLINLEVLTVLDCPELRNWCELEENKTKIGQLKGKIKVATSEDETE